MDDKLIMDNILSTTKGACDLMMHGAINDTLCMQNEIYKKMSQKGWYPMQQVEQQKISAAKQKFSGQ